MSERGKASNGNKLCQYCWTGSREIIIPDVLHKQQMSLIHALGASKLNLDTGGGEGMAREDNIQNAAQVSHCMAVAAKFWGLLFQTPLWFWTQAIIRL